MRIGRIGRPRQFSLLALNSWANHNTDAGECVLPRRWPRRFSLLALNSWANQYVGVGVSHALRTSWQPEERHQACADARVWIGLNTA